MKILGFLKMMRNVPRSTLEQRLWRITIALLAMPGHPLKRLSMPDTSIPQMSIVNGSAEGYSGQENTFGTNESLDLSLITSGTDTVDGGLGEDTLRGRGGGDAVLAGGGNDLVYVGANNDSVDGGAGDDILTGG